MRLKKNISIEFIETRLKRLGWIRNYLAPDSFTKVKWLVMERRGEQTDARLNFLTAFSSIDRISMSYITTSFEDVILDIKYRTSSVRAFTGPDDIIMGMMGWSDLTWCRLTPINVY